MTMKNTNREHTCSQLIKKKESVIKENGIWVLIKSVDHELRIQFCPYCGEDLYKRVDDLKYYMKHTIKTATSTNKDNETHQSSVYHGPFTTIDDTLIFMANEIRKKDNDYDFDMANEHEEYMPEKTKDGLFEIHYFDLVKTNEPVITWN